IHFPKAAQHEVAGKQVGGAVRFRPILNILFVFIYSIPWAKSQGDVKQAALVAPIVIRWVLCLVVIHLHPKDLF
ncbi:MAG: hypothetical protein AAFP19_14045, partial [Bacteroidota bacterium]